MSKEVYYLYRHTTVDTGEVFYIGIGKVSKRHISSKNPSTYFSRAYNTSRRNRFWKRINDKHKRTVEILKITDDESLIKELEILLINYYGRRDIGEGTLCNLTDGGEGFVGLVKTEEHKRKIGEKSKGRKPSAETIEKIRLTNTGKKLSEETRKTLSLKTKGTRLGKENPFFGKRHSEENKKRWSESKKGSLNPNAKWIVCLETGIFYLGIAEASEAVNIKYGALRSMLQGKNRNKTSLQYC